MKVYVITSGIYSDYGIRAVALDKEEAERKCALLNNNVYCDDYYGIEEYDTEYMKISDSEDVKIRFCMVVGYKDEEIRIFYDPYLVTKNVNKISIRRCGDDEIVIIATFSKGTTEEEARKIMLDRIAKFKAERERI